MEEKIVRKKNVEDLTQMSSTQIDRMEHEGNFPRRRQITERIVGWSYLEIQAWINARLHGESETDRLNGESEAAAGRLTR